MAVVYLSIGSNLGNRKWYIRSSFEKLNHYGTILRISHVYRTKPYGRLEQPDFLNLAVEFSTKLNPQDLLTRIHQIEEELGRTRELRWGPRTIDLDILFYDSEIIDLPDLRIPHPDLCNRDFVLKPMMDICPDYQHPVYQKSIRQILNEMNQSQNYSI